MKRTLHKQGRGLKCCGRPPNLKISRTSRHKEDVVILNVQNLEECTCSLSHVFLCGC